MSVRTDVSESTRIIGGRRSAESSRVASRATPLARRAACAGLLGFFAPLTAGASLMAGDGGVASCGVSLVARRVGRIDSSFTLRQASPGVGLGLPLRQLWSLQAENYEFSAR